MRRELSLGLLVIGASAASAQSTYYPNTAFPGITHQFAQEITTQFFCDSRRDVQWPNGAPGSRVLDRKVWGSFDNQAPWIQSLKVLSDTPFLWKDTTPRVAKTGGTTYVLLMWEEDRGSMNYTRVQTAIPYPDITSHTRSQIWWTNLSVAFNFVPAGS